MRGHAAGDRVLVVAPSWVGDAILSEPLVAALEAVQFKLGKTSLDLWMVLHGAFKVVVTILLALWVAGLIEARLAETAIDSSMRAVLLRR